MALGSIRVAEMIEISTPWVTEGEAARMAIERIPLLAAVLPELMVAHAGLFDLPTRTPDPRLPQLSRQQAELDKKYRLQVRGIWESMGGVARVSKDGAELLCLRALLFPQGLRVNKLTYAGEAGHAILVAARLTPARQARLKDFTFHDANLYDLVYQWLAVARQLGQLEDERARLRGSPKERSTKRNAARNRWVRAAKCLMANAKLANLAEQDRATYRLIFANVRVVADRVARRGNKTGLAKSGGGQLPSAQAGPASTGLEPSSASPAGHETTPAQTQGLEEIGLIYER